MLCGVVLVVGRWLVLRCSRVLLLLRLLLMGLVSALRGIAPIALLWGLPCANRLRVGVAFPLQPAVAMIVVVELRVTYPKLVRQEPKPPKVDFTSFLSRRSSPIVIVAIAILSTTRNITEFLN